MTKKAKEPLARLTLRGAHYEALVRLGQVHQDDLVDLWVLFADEILSVREYTTVHFLFPRTGEFYNLLLLLIFPIFSARFVFA